MTLHAWPIPARRWVSMGFVAENTRSKGLRGM